MNRKRGPKRLNVLIRIRKSKTYYLFIFFFQTSVTLIRYSVRAFRYFSHVYLACTSTTQKINKKKIQQNVHKIFVFFLYKLNKPFVGFCLVLCLKITKQKKNRILSNQSVKYG